MEIIDISYFARAIHAAAQMGVKSILIEPEGIRGIDEDRRVVFFQKGHLPFGLVAIGETIYLSKRLKLFKHLEEVDVNFNIKHASAGELTEQVELAKQYDVLFKVNSNESNSEACIRLYEAIKEKTGSCEKEIKNIDAGSNKSDIKIKTIEETISALYRINRDVYKLRDYVQTIDFSEGDINLKQRCIPPSNIMPPKQINDSPKYLIDIKKSHVISLKNICSAVSSNSFHLTASKDGVFLYVLDDDYSGAEFNIKIGETDDDIEFDHEYRTKPFVELINCDKRIYIGENGLIKVSHDGFIFYLIPDK